MAVTDLPERLLQQAVHLALTEPSRTWECTNGDTIQVIAAGLPNVYAGPDFSDMAVLHHGTVVVGNGEFHVRESDWLNHNHTGNPDYEHLLLHIVMVRDTPLPGVARWTLQVPAADVSDALRRQRHSKVTTVADVEEIQHFALLRLMRQTATARQAIKRVGKAEALKFMVAGWTARLMARRHRPLDTALMRSLRTALVASPLGRLVAEIETTPAPHLVLMLQSAERYPIAAEGIGVRREVVVNVILPALCAAATQEQRVVLLQWYWSTPAIHAYAILRQRFANQSQHYVWQQQGMLEYLRMHGKRISTCGETLRSYGVDGILEFIRASGVA